MVSPSNLFTTIREKLQNGKNTNNKSILCNPDPAQRDSGSKKPREVSFLLPLSGKESSKNNNLAGITYIYRIVATFIREKDEKINKHNAYNDPGSVNEPFWSIC